MGFGNTATKHCLEILGLDLLLLALWQPRRRQGWWRTSWWRWTAGCRWPGTSSCHGPRGLPGDQGDFLYCWYCRSGWWLSDGAVDFNYAAIAAADDNDGNVGQVAHCELYTTVSWGSKKSRSVVCSTYTCRLVVLEKIMTMVIKTVMRIHDSYGETWLAQQWQWWLWRSCWLWWWW